MMDLDVPIKLGNGCPFIIKYYGALEAESYIWILNEIMDTSLDKFYKETFQLKLKMNELFISKIAYSVLEALDYMKEKHLLHRDIKPSNILINSTGEVKVCDFGISGILNNSVAHTFKGSECYMPVSCLLFQNLCFINKYTNNDRIYFYSQKKYKYQMKDMESKQMCGR